MFRAIGRFSFRFRYGILAAWIVLFCCGLLATTQLGHVLQGGGFTDPSSPSEQAAAQIRQRLHQGLTTVDIIFGSRTLDARSARFVAAEKAALRDITPAAVSGMTQVRTYADTGSSMFVSRSGHSSVAMLVFDIDAERVRARGDVARIRALIRPTGLTVAITGDPVFREDLQNESAHDLRVVESYALPVTLIALIFVFGSLIAAALPVVTGALAVSTTLGAVWVLANLTQMSIFVMNTATLLGLAVGIDYALFTVARFREELAAGSSKADAVAATVEHAGRSVFFSGLAVAIGMLGLSFFPFAGLRSIGIGGAVVVFFSVAAALTLLPAILGMLGPRVNALRVTRLHRAEGSRFWRAWSGTVLRWSPLVIVVALGLIALLASPVLHMKTEMPTATVLPSGAPARVGYDLLRREFDPAALSPVSVMLTWQGDPNALTEAHMLSFWSFGQKLAATPGVASVSSLVNLPGMTTLPQLASFWRGMQAAQNGQLPQGAAPVSAAQIRAIKQLIASTTGDGAVMFRVTANSDPATGPARALADRLRRTSAPPGMRVWVAGESAGGYDFFHGISATFPWVVVFVVGATYLVLLVLLRSVVLPLKAVLVNSCTILMSFGTIVFIFQHGRFENLLSYTSSGYIDAVMPVVTFCALFGVSMDYEVFSLTRMREEWQRSYDNQAAITAGLVRSGRVILSAALLVVIVAGSFAFTRVAMTKELGVGIAAAITLDALLIRMALVPAIMRWLGRVNWWLPSWLRLGLAGFGRRRG